MYGLTEIKVALKGNNIADLLDKELERVIQEALATIFADLSRVPEKHDVTYLVGELFKFIKHKYKHLRKDEIKIAFRNGVQGKYGEYFGVNFVSLSMFLEKYATSEERAKAIIEQRPERLLEAPAQEPIDVMQRVKELYRDFKKTGICDDIGNVAYDYLDAQAKIEFTPEQKRKFMELAHAEMLILFDPKKAKDLQELREKDRKLVSLLQGKLEGLKKVKAKKLALIEHFKNNKYE
jgi:hypothetical protein